MDEAPIPESEFYHTSRELITERAVEEKEPCSAPLEQSGTEETRAKGSAYCEEAVHEKHKSHQGDKMGKYSCLRRTPWTS